jgi:hypothetical protein
VGIPISRQAQKKSKTKPIGPAFDRGYAKVWKGDLPPNCLIINVLHSNSTDFLFEGAKLRKNLLPNFIFYTNFHQLNTNFQKQEFMEQFMDNLWPFVFYFNGNAK